MFESMKKLYNFSKISYCKRLFYTQSIYQCNILKLCLNHTFGQSLCPKQVPLGRWWIGIPETFEDKDLFYL